MVYQHLLAHRDVEFVSDERVYQMPGQRGIASDRTRYRDAPPFVLVAVRLCGSNRESWQLIEEEVQAVIVVKHHCDVGLFTSYPAVNKIKAGKKWAPIRIVLLIFRNRFAD